MPKIENFLEGFLGTSAKIVTEKRKEKKITERQDEIRRQKNADELSMYTKKLEIATKSKETSAIAKAKRERESIKAFGESINLNIGSSDEAEGLNTLTDVNRALQAAHLDPSLPDRFIDALEIRKQDIKEKGEEARRPNTTAFDSESRKLINESFSTTEDNVDNPLFEPGIKPSVRISKTQAKRRGILFTSDRVGPDGRVLVDVEPVHRSKATSTTRDLSAKANAKSKENALGIVNVFKDNRTGKSNTPRKTILEDEVADAAQLELALNTIEFGTDIEDKKLKLQSVIDIWEKKGLIGKVNLMTQPFINDSRRQAISDLLDAQAQDETGVSEEPVQEVLDTSPEDSPILNEEDKSSILSRAKSRLEVLQDRPDFPHLRKQILDDLKSKIPELDENNFFPLVVPPPSN